MIVDSYFLLKSRFCCFFWKFTRVIYRIVHLANLANWCQFCGFEIRGWNPTLLFIYFYNLCIKYNQYNGMGSRCLFIAASQVHPQICPTFLCIGDRVWSLLPSGTTRPVQSRWKHGALSTCRRETVGFGTVPSGNPIWKMDPLKIVYHLSMFIIVYRFTFWVGSFIPGFREEPDVVHQQIISRIFQVVAAKVLEKCLVDFGRNDGCWMETLLWGKASFWERTVVVSTPHFLRVGF